MTQALELAARALYTTTPNPRVGCVLVRDNEIVGQGWHQQAGGPHAEVMALQQAGDRANGATCYVTLEPCSHHGRTPPCSQALVAAGVKHVVIAMQDPNPVVAGQGIAHLNAAGISTELGVLSEQAEVLNKGFLQRMRTGRPYVRCKLAMSLDGRTALANGDSHWITSQAARDDVQHWRAQSCAIMTGINTVLADNPQLNVRLPDAQRQPLRVILDSHLQIKPEHKILENPGQVLVATTLDQTLPYVETLCVPGNSEQQVDLDYLLQALAERDINEILVEAGATLAGSFVSTGLVDELILYVAPKLLGSDARGLLHLPSLTRLDQASSWKYSDAQPVGQDWRFILERD